MAKAVKLDYSRRIREREPRFYLREVATLAILMFWKECSRLPLNTINYETRQAQFATPNDRKGIRLGCCRPQKG